MDDHTKMSWKNENVISQLRNSIEHATTAVGQAQSHPNEQLIQQARNMIERADHALMNAVQNSPHQEPVQQLQQQLNQNKERLYRLMDI